MNAQLTLRRSLLTAVLSVLLLIPACGGSETHEGPWFKVKTLVDRQVCDGYCEWITIPEAATIQGWWVQDNIAAGGTIKGFGPLTTSILGNYTLDNARLSAWWRFKAWDGPCKFQYFKRDGTGDDHIPVQSGELITLWCTHAMFIGGSITIGAETIDAEGNVVPLACCNTDTLYADNPTTLHPGDYIHSPDGHFILTLTYSGAAAVFDTTDGTLLWMTAEAGSGAELRMQDDGNLVLYNSGNGAVWFSGTNGNSHSYLTMQNDGNLVLYAANGNALWSSWFGLAGGGGGGGGGGRWKDDGNGGCYWDPNDSGPNQCLPPGSH
jgi:hypothetical protein